MPQANLVRQSRVSRMLTPQTERPAEEELVARPLPAVGAEGPAKCNTRQIYPTQESQTAQGHQQVEARPNFFAKGGAFQQRAGLEL
jgi:hypothetical protein